MTNVREVSALSTRSSRSASGSSAPTVWRSIAHPVALLVLVVATLLTV